MANAHERIVFPLDYPNLAAAEAGAAVLAGSVGVLKVGLELFVREGPKAVKLGERHGASVFLDLKLHDIPATVEHAVASAATLGAKYLTVHASGGRAMLEAAARQAEKQGGGLTLLAVTVLTSLGDEDLRELGMAGTAAERALSLARLAQDCGIGGIVCSPHEARSIRELLGPSATIVTPGIRPASTELGDQKRAATPEAAIQAGADLLVVGRPIRSAPDPAAAARAVAEEIAGALP